MSELLPCPFCKGEAEVCEGGVNGKRQVYGLVEHKDGCFFLADGLPTKYQHIMENEFDIWNSRAKQPCDGGYCPLCGANERTCHIVKNSRKYVLSDGRELFDDGCSICNGYVGDGDNYCSNCGARAVDE